MKMKSGLSAGIAFCGLMSASLVFAQTSEPGAHSSSRIEEIVVTADRRQENIQKVPITVSAVTAVTMAKRGYTDLRLAAQAIPALDFGQQVNSATPFLRGVGNEIGSVGNEPSVATYVDGVYQTTGYATLGDFNGVERLEVLKGPQGTLFGRNATGGVVQIITKDPTATPEADVSLGYGSYNAVTSSLYATSAITDKLSANLALQGHDQLSGWGTNLANGEDIYKSRSYSGRMKLLWKPTDDTRILLTASAWYNRDQEGDIYATIPGYKSDIGTMNAGFFNAYINGSPSYTDRGAATSLNIQQDLNWAKLVSISSFSKYRPSLVLDDDGTAANIVLANIKYAYEDYSEELQLQSPANSHLKWILGTFYYYDSAGYAPSLISGAGVAPAPAVLVETGAQQTNSVAGFGQATAEILPGWNLTGGLRYTLDRRSIDIDESIGGFQLASDFENHKDWEKLTWRFALDHQFNDSTMGYISDNRGFKSGVFDLGSFRNPPANPEVLDAYEIGVKNDLFDHRLRLNADAFYYDYQDMQVAQVLTFTTETLNAAAATIEGLEADFTAKPVDRLTLNGGVALMHGSYSTFENGPHFIQTPSTPGPYTAPQYCSNNVDPNSAGGAVSVVGCNLSGKNTIHTPRVSFNIGADYSLPSTVGDWDFNVSYSYQTQYAEEPDQSVIQAAHGILNASANLALGAGNWEVRFWGKNLTDTHYYAFANNTGGCGECYSPAAPLTVGFTVTAHLK